MSDMTTRGESGWTVAAQLGAAGFDDAHEIGRGGFGIVFRCRQVELDRVVAVKVLTTPMADDHARFAREKRAMAKLTGHPNIVVVLQVGETRSGYPFLVMPYCSRGSVDDQISRQGALSQDRALRMGVELADALESAHRVGIVHRDVKPANVLLTDYGAHALTDFGISHMVDAFRTASGLFTGSPAFTPPEVVIGEEPGEAADVYGLGATLFCALTGHSAYERRSGEQVVAQLLRIATDPVPDLREHGISKELAMLVSEAMSRRPANRPSMVALSEQLQLLQGPRGLTSDEMGSAGDSLARRIAQTAPQALMPRSRGNLPAELHGFVGRGAELSRLRELLSTARVVTLAGAGGVGKSSLALTSAHQELASFSDGVWWIELDGVREAALLTDQVVTTLGVREQCEKSGRPPVDVLVDVLANHQTLLVFDKCEHLVDEVAHLGETLLRRCPRLQILATSREVTRIGGEGVLELSPLPYPDTESAPAPVILAGYEAVALFIERARAAQPGFALTEYNAALVARICARLDGSPLAIELAAARLRAMSLEQIAQWLLDRFAFLTRGRHGPPSPQETLNWCIEWSYERCTATEQRLWQQLSVFEGSFDLDAARAVCAQDGRDDELLDDFGLDVLVDKAILLHTTRDGVDRFQMLEPLREIGNARISTDEDYRQRQRRHLHWYQQPVTHAGPDSTPELSPDDAIDRVRARTTVSNNRGRTGLGPADGSRPFLLSPEKLTLVRATAAVVAEHAEEITAHFYPRMFAAHPELLRIFNHGNQATGEQSRNLASSVVAYAMQLVDHEAPSFDYVKRRIAYKHYSLGIRPEQYTIVGEHLLAAVGEVLGDAITPEVAAAWGDVYWLFAIQLVAEEARLYQQTNVDPAKPTRPYRLVRRIEETADILSLVLEATDGGPLPAIVPGQYVSVFVDLPNGDRQPRQYTVSSTAVRTHLQITVRRVRGANGAPDGRVSNFLHDHLKVGDLLDVSAPAGDFVLTSSESPLLLASAGSGITTVLPIVEHIARNQPHRTVIVAHYDRRAQDHALRQTILHLGREIADFTSHTWYEVIDDGDTRSRQGLMDLTDIALPTAIQVFTCGPLPFMRHVRSALLARGIPPSRIRYEVFGPDMWVAQTKANFG